MTISSTTRKAGPFDGNGVTTSFPFTFKVFAKSDLRVVRTIPLGIEETLVLNSDYSVTLNGDQDANPGGTITYPVSGDPLPADWRLTLVGDIDYLQPTDITSGGGFYPQVIENALDRNVMLIQQVAEEAGRSIRIAVSDDVTGGLDLPASANRSDKVLGFDAIGNFRVYDTNISVRATGIEVFTATSGQTVFTTPFTYVPNANTLLVFQNGAVLTPGVAFTETSGTSFTLTVGATLNDTVVALAGLDVTGGVPGSAIIDGSVTAIKLASTLDLTGKTVTVATAGGSDSDTSVASTAMVQAAITARTASESAAGILEIATDAEARAFTANKAIDGAKLATAFTGTQQSIGTNGYQRLPGGLIIQWGTTGVASGGLVAVTWPLAFPTAFLSATATGIEIGNNGGLNGAAAVSVAGSTTGITWGLPTGKTCHWIAIGY